MFCDFFKTYLFQHSFPVLSNIAFYTTKQIQFDVTKNSLATFVFILFDNGNYRIQLVY